MRTSMENYMAKDWLYFNVNEYISDALNTLFDAIRSFHYVIHEANFKCKKDLLDFQAELLGPLDAKIV